MDYLPIFLDLRGRTCLIVGGGPVALRKVQLLLQAGAQVRIVAPKLCPRLRVLAKRKSVTVAARTYTTRDLKGACVVIAATDSPEVNARVAAAAQARAIPVNVVDEPGLCSFIMPAIVDRGALVVAVSTAGASPVLARLTRARLEAMLPASIGELALFAKRHRTLVKQHLADLPSRRAFWERVLDGEIAELVLAGHAARADAALRKALAQPIAHSAVCTALIGAGDGDAAQLSLAAARWLGRADLIVHERGVPAAVLALGRRDAERITLGRPGPRRDRLFRTMAERAALGNVVCIVRAGDPDATRPSAEATLLRKLGVRYARLRPAPT